MSDGVLQVDLWRISLSTICCSVLTGATCLYLLNWQCCPIWHLWEVGLLTGCREFRFWNNFPVSSYGLLYFDISKHKHIFSYFWRGSGTDRQAVPREKRRWWWAGNRETPPCRAWMIMEASSCCAICFASGETVVGGVGDAPFTCLLLLRIVSGASEVITIRHYTSVYIIIIIIIFCRTDDMCTQAYICVCA